MCNVVLFIVGFVLTNTIGQGPLPDFSKYHLCLLQTVFLRSYIYSWFIFRNQFKCEGILTSLSSHTIKADQT